MTTTTASPMHLVIGELLARAMRSVRAKKARANGPMSPSGGAVRASWAARHYAGLRTHMFILGSLLTICGGGGTMHAARMIAGVRAVTSRLFYNVQWQSLDPAWVTPAGRTAVPSPSASERSVQCCSGSRVAAMPRSPRRAGRHGMFAAYHDDLYRNQSRIGIIPWDSVARRVGIRDLATVKR